MGEESTVVKKEARSANWRYIGDGGGVECRKERKSITPSEVINVPHKQTCYIYI